MAKGYCIFVLIFCFTFESLAQNNLRKIISEHVTTTSPLLDTLQSALEEADSLTISPRKGKMLPAPSLGTDRRTDSLLSNSLVLLKIGQIKQKKLTGVKQFVYDDLSFDSLPGSSLEKLPMDIPLNGSMKELHVKEKDIVLTAFQSIPAKVDSLKSFPGKDRMLPTFKTMSGMKADSLMSDGLLSDKFSQIKKEKLTGVKQFVDRDLGFDSLPGSLIKKLPVDTPINGTMNDLHVKDKDIFQKALQSIPVKADSLKSFPGKDSMLPTSKIMAGMKEDSLISGGSLSDKFSQIKEENLTGLKQFVDGDVSFDSLPKRLIELPADTPLNGSMKELQFKDRETFQKAFQSTPAKADSLKTFLRKDKILPIFKLGMPSKGDSLLPEELLGNKIPPIKEETQTGITQYFDDDFRFDSLSGSFIEKLPVDTGIDGQMKDFLLKDGENLQNVFKTQPEDVDSLRNFLQKGKMLPKSSMERVFSTDSLFSDHLLGGTAGQIKEDSPVDFSQYFKKDFSFDSIPSTVLKRFSADSLFGGHLQDFSWKDTDQFQKGLESQFTKEIGGEEIGLEDVKQKQAMAKRVISIKDREIVDSIRSLASDKLYRIREDVQDSLSVYLVSEKKKLKENLFFEGLVSMEKYKDNVSVSDFSGSLGVRLSKFYEMGLGPEIGVSGNDFSALGARVFARRKIFEDKLFVIVENSFTRNPDFSEVVTAGEGLYSKLKLGAGRLFNLSSNGETKLNIQTLLNPQSLNGGYENVVDFRLGISKLSHK